MPVARADPAMELWAVAEAGDDIKGVAGEHESGAAPQPYDPRELQPRVETQGNISLGSRWSHRLPSAIG
jgi:hypothetical protein